METIELQLDAGTLERGRQVAASRRCTLDEVIQAISSQLARAEAARVPLWGVFAPEPELIDQVAESAMQAREKRLLRQNRD
jgi:hypothetical protein